VCQVQTRTAPCAAPNSHAPNAAAAEQGLQRRRSATGPAPRKQGLAEEIAAARGEGRVQTASEVPLLHRQGVPPRHGNRAEVQCPFNGKKDEAPSGKVQVHTVALGPRAEYVDSSTNRAVRKTREGHVPLRDCCRLRPGAPSSQPRALP
jgi:hypothetical protein